MRLVLFLRSVYGSTNPYAHVMSMLLHMKATPKNVAKPDAIRIPISLTLNEVNFILIFNICLRLFYKHNYLWITNGIQNILKGLNN